MSRRWAIRLTQTAIRQIETDNEWWRRNRPLVPTAIEEELERAFSLISSQPKVGTKTDDADLKSVRRILLARVGYHLYYRTEGSKIVVLAVWHVRRGSKPEF